MGTFKFKVIHAKLDKLNSSVTTLVFLHKSKLIMKPKTVKDQKNQYSF